MTNEEIYKEMIEVSQRINDLDKQNRLDERNELVPRYRELYKKYDFGFSLHEVVETTAWRSRWSVAKITECTDDNRFLVCNEKGWECYVSGTSIRKLVAPQKEQHIEQLSLF